MKSGFQAVVSKGRHRQRFDLGLSQLFMIAMGGIIGAGIFVASGTPIRLAGPGVVISYLIGGGIVGLVMMILGEMTAADPSSGSFSHYANKHLGPAMGFVTGWMYWSSGIFAMATEVTAASLLSRFWFPEIPLWAFSLFYSLLVTLINFLDLRGFGKAEAWLSSVKVLALSLFILAGAMVLLGSPPNKGMAVALSWQEIFPRGWFGIYSSMLLVIFAYAGMQSMIIAAAGVSSPAIKIPRAIIISIAAVTILYTFSLAVIVALVPWSTAGTAVSPFVTTLGKIGIPAAGEVFNFVVLTAVLSSMNTTMFATSRMLHSLAERKEAPVFFLKKSASGVPIYSLLTNSAALGIFVILAFALPRNLFIYVSSSSVFITLFNWIVIIATYLVYKRTLLRDRGKRNYLFKPLLALALLLGVISSIPFVPEQIPGMFAGLVLLALYLAGHLVFYRRARI